MWREQVDGLRIASGVLPIQAHEAGERDFQGLLGGVVLSHQAIRQLPQRAAQGKARLHLVDQRGQQPGDLGDAAGPVHPRLGEPPGSGPFTGGIEQLEAPDLHQISVQGTRDWCSRMNVRVT